MKLFLFVALFAVSASAFSLDSINALSWAEEIQEIFDCVNKMTQVMANGPTYNSESVVPQFDSATKNFQKMFLIVLDAKYEDYDMSALAKVKSIFKDKWDTLKAQGQTDSDFVECFNALIPSLVKDALDAAKDKTIDEDAIVTLIKKYLDELKALAWGAEDVSVWVQVVEGTTTTPFDFAFNPYMGVALNEKIRDNVRSALTTKAASMGQNTHATKKDEFYELMKLSVRGALKKAIKDARDITPADLKNTLDSARTNTQNDPKTAAPYANDELDRWAVAIMAELNKLLLAANYNPCAIEIIMEMFEPKVKCAAAICDQTKMDTFLTAINSADTKIATDMKEAWDEVKDDLAPLNSVKKCKTPAVAPAPAAAPATTTPCASPSSWSNRRPATNWWNC